MTTIKRFPKTTKFIVQSGNISMFATANAIRSGLGTSTKFNAATQKALEALEHIRSGSGIADQCAVGVCGTWEGLQIQIDKI